MLFSKFQSLYDNVPKAESISWSEFIQRYNKHIIAPEKNAVEAISPAEWPLDAQRKKADVLRVHFAALDLDGVSREAVDRIKSLLAPTSYLMYSTWSHAQSYEESGLCYLRVFINLSRPVEIREWKRFWEGLNQFVGGFLDEACKDAGRIYFVPSAPKESSLNRVIAQEKEPLDVEKVLRMSASRQPKQRDSSMSASTYGVTRESLVALARSLRAKVNPNQQQLGLCLKKVLDKEPFAEPGKRDTTLFKLASLLAEHWPDADARELASYFKFSLLEMAEQEPDAPTLDDVIEKISRKQEEARDKSSQEVDADQENLETRILEICAGKRSHGYTPEEIEQFAADAKVPLRIFNRRWLIQCGESNYLFVNGDYLPPVSSKYVVNAALNAFAPAHTAGVSVEYTTSKGRRSLKSEKELYRDYGTTATRVLADMSAQKSFYDWETRVFTEAVCPMRSIEPVFSEKVDRYLRTLAGEFQEKLLDWVATVTYLDSPTAALYLHGVGGAGKTMLANGLARIWKAGEPTSLADIVDKFNDSLSSCPIVLADESLPRTLKKEGSTADLRHIIQGRSRPLRRKYKGPADIVGACRLILCANNKNMLGMNEYLSAEDVNALQDRILYLYSGKESEAYLNSLTHADRKNFVDGDEVAQHAMWLRDNRKVEIGHRFLVKGNTSNFHHSLATSTGIRSALCNWLTSYLQEPNVLDNAGQLLVRIHDGELLVNAKALSLNWDTYGTNVKPPTSTLISSGLSGLSSSKKQLPGLNRKPTNYWRIRTDLLTSWNEETDYATREEILAALKTNTPDPTLNSGKELST